VSSDGNKYESNISSDNVHNNNNNDDDETNIEDGQRSRISQAVYMAVYMAVYVAVYQSLNEQRLW
jgi:hypothetical protein